MWLRARKVRIIRAEFLSLTKEKAIDEIIRNPQAFLAVSSSDDARFLVEKH